VFQSAPLCYPGVELRTYIVIAILCKESHSLSAERFTAGGLSKTGFSDCDIIEQAAIFKGPSRLGMDYCSGLRVMPCDSLEDRVVRHCNQGAEPDEGERSDGTEAPEIDGFGESQRCVRGRPKTGKSHISPIEAPRARSRLVYEGMIRLRSSPIEAGPAPNILE